MADVATGAVQGSVADAVNLLLGLFGNVVLDPGGNPNTDAQAAIAQLSTAGCDDFNAKYPDDPTVAYFSIAGRSENGDGDRDCGSATEAPFIEKWDQDHGPINALLAPTASLIDGSGSPSPTNDGLVTVASARWGTFLGCVPADHLAGSAESGEQSSGSGYDCVTMYRDVAGATRRARILSAPMVRYVRRVKNTIAPRRPRRLRRAGRCASAAALLAFALQLQGARRLDRQVRRRSRLLHARRRREESARHAGQGAARRRSR